MGAEQYKLCLKMILFCYQHYLAMPVTPVCHVRLVFMYHCIMYIPTSDDDTGQQSPVSMCCL